MVKQRVCYPCLFTYSTIPFVFFKKSVFNVTVHASITVGTETSHLVNEHNFSSGCPAFFLPHLADISVKLLFTCFHSYCSSALIFSVYVFVPVLVLLWIPNSTELC